VGVIVNGQRGTLVNLSSMGAQLLMLLRVRPNEPLRLSLVDASADVRVQGVVAWSAAEPSGTGMTYRAGIEFINPDSLTLGDFCMRHLAAREGARA
jgi:hypothetical protein